MFEFSLLSFVIIAAVIDSINPHLIDISLLTASKLQGAQKGNTALVKLGPFYLIGMAGSYMLLGFILTQILATMSLKLAVWLLTGLVVAVIGYGIIRIRQFFWAPKSRKLRVLRLPAKLLSDSLGIGNFPQHALRMFILGVFASTVRFVLTGIILISVVAVIIEATLAEQIITLLLFSLVSILPHVLIIFGSILRLPITRLSTLSDWERDPHELVHLFLGATFIGFAWALILIINDIILLT